MVTSFDSTGGLILIDYNTWRHVALFLILDPLTFLLRFPKHCSLPMDKVLHYYWYCSKPAWDFQPETVAANKMFSKSKRRVASCCEVMYIAFHSSYFFLQ